MLQIAGFTIGYQTDLTKEYVQDKNAVESLDGLHDLARKWQPFLGDAYALMIDMTDAQFEEYQEGAHKESQGDFAGRAWALTYGHIQIPAPLLTIASVAKHYDVPEGLALLTLIEHNMARIRDECVELHVSLFGGVGDGWRR